MLPLVNWVELENSKQWFEERICMKIISVREVVFGKTRWLKTPLYLSDTESDQPSGKDSIRLDTI